MRTVRLSSRFFCTICGKEDTAIDDRLGCNHGPAGPKCQKEILEGNRKCQLCTAPPKYTLLEVEAEAQRASSDSDFDHLSPPNTLIEDLDEWVNIMRDGNDSDN